MRILPSDAGGIAAALEILHSGGIVAHATETCYGFACDVRNLEAVKKLFSLKQRPPDQPVSVLFASIDDAKKYVEWNDEAESLAKKYLPGPLTLILPLRKDAPFTLHTAIWPSGHLTIGVRISSHHLARHLVESFGSPVSTTSANLHSESNPYSPDEILKLQPDLILDSGILPHNPPSTIIDLTNALKTLRQGKVLP